MIITILIVVLIVVWLVIAPIWSMEFANKFRKLLGMKLHGGQE